MKMAHAALVGFGILFAFWSKADATGGSKACWEWTAARNYAGYGQFRWNGKRTTAIRLAHLFSGGRAPAVHRVVRHTCDNPSCINPSHLLFGTFADNTADMMRRGRWVITTAKLRPASVVEIRRELAAGDHPNAIGKRHRISNQAIYDIRAGRTWAHLVAA